MLAEKSTKELREIAKKLGIKGYSRMRKSEILSEIKKIQTEKKTGPKTARKPSPKTTIAERLEEKLSDIEIDRPPASRGRPPASRGRPPASRGRPPASRTAGRPPGRPPASRGRPPGRPPGTGGKRRRSPRKTTLSRSSVRELMRENGGKTVSADSIDYFLDHLEKYAIDLVRKSLAHTKHSNRKKLTVDDLEYELSIRNR